MSKQNNGYMGAVVGTLGPAVGYFWNGKSCMRSKPAVVRNPRTEKQQRWRRIFSAATSLAAEMHEVMDYGLRGEARRHGMTARNLFISLNRQCITFAGDTPRVDYMALRVAAGQLEGVSFEAPQMSLPLTVEVPFRELEGGNGGNGGDYVYLYAFAPALERGRLSLPAWRCQQQVVLTLPDSFAGCEVQLYGFVWDRDAMASPSVWIGEMTI